MSINFTKDIVSLKKYFQKKMRNSPPIIRARIKPAVLACDVHIKDANNSPRSLKTANIVLIALIIINRTISRIMSNGVLIMFIL